MPVAKEQVRRPLIPAGEHILTLLSVDEREVDNTFKPGTKQIRWMWLFQAQKKDPEGVPYEFPLWTNDSYGAPKASLTQLYDSIMPGITVEKATKFNTDRLLNAKFKTFIKHEKNDKGEPRARLIKIELIKKASQPEPEPEAEPEPAIGEDEAEFDPFADE